MGVDLRDIMDSEDVEISSLSGRKIAVDAFNTIYQFLSIIRQMDGTPLMDSKGEITSHLSGIFYRNINLLQKGVQPIYVFDGEPPVFKKVSEERKDRKKEAQEKYEKALKEGDMVSARKYAQQTSKLTQDMVEDSKELLEAMGIPVVQAPSEGEAQAAYMCRKGDAWAVASQDYDSLLFGSPRVLRNINITGKRKVPGKESYTTVNPEIIVLEKNLARLGLGQEQLIMLGILVGTDYNPGGIKGIGPKRGLELVKAGNMNEILEETGWEFDTEPEKLMDWFKNPKVISKYALSRKKPDEERIIRFLSDKHDFSIDRVKSGLEKLRKPPQSNLHSFFN
jgi:flap endonuclease-1